MAIAEMRKLNVAAMTYDRDAILNALQKTGAAEIKSHSEEENAAPFVLDFNGTSEYLSSLEAALNILCTAVENYERDNKIKSDILKDGFDVDYSDFMAAKDKKAQADETVAKINALADKKNALFNERAKNERLINSARAYAAVKEPLSGFRDTSRAIVRLGEIPVNEKDNFYARLKELDLADCEELGADADTILICFVAHNSVKAEAEELLSSCGFIPCAFNTGLSGEQLYAEALKNGDELYGQTEDNRQSFYELKEEIKPLKVYCDYVGFELEKAELSEKFLSTERTVLIEAYVPAGEEERVSEAINGVTSAVYYEFSNPSEDETPPTLMRNKEVVSNFEAITNMYSVPSSREFDPSTVMAFFYSLFMGFIMADIGYGLIMVIGGAVIYFKTRARDGGLKRLSGVFAVGGIFAIVWGVLFNSFFGVSFSFMPTVMPNAQNDMWALAGINVPAVLIISLIIGTFQLFAGYLCKAVQCWRRGQITDGFFDGVTWAVFSLGVALAIVGFVDEANMKILAYVGGIMAAAGLVMAMLTAGRHEKAFGKFTKGFGAAYGVINYLSDVLSYARLYGLMLSGAVIAQIVSSYAINFITGGNVAFIILGVILMVVGHAFNLAMNLLSAYIHDARLQYVEFYGKFYEGEGELFAPIGSQHKYIYLKA